MKLFSNTTRTSILTLCLALLTLFVWQQQSSWFKALSNPVSAAAPAGRTQADNTSHAANAAPTSSPTTITWDGGCYSSQVGGTGSSVTITKTWNGTNYDVHFQGYFTNIFSPTFGHIRKAVPPGFRPVKTAVDGDATSVYSCTGTFTPSDGGAPVDVTTMGNCCDGIPGIHFRSDTFAGYENGSFWLQDKANGRYDLVCDWQTADANPTDNWASCSGVQLPNTPPSITPLPLTSKAGSLPGAVNIAMVGDAETPVGMLGVIVNGGAMATANGVTVSNLAVSAAGVVTANVVADCTATTATFTLKVTDSGGLMATATLTVTVTANMPPTLSYNATNVVAGTTPVISPAAGPSDNGTINPLVLQPIAPATGLTLSLNPASGQLQVTGATLAGNYTVTVTATDNCGATTNAQFTVTVACPTVSLSPASLPNATINTAYPQTIGANPAGGNYSFAVTSGLLPAGLTLNADGSFSGAPTQSGTFNFRVTATGFGSCSAFQDYTLVVNCSPITLAPTSLPGGSIGTAYNQSVSAAPAGTYSYAVSSGALPPGLSLNAATGAITGTPGTGGSFNFTVTASQGGCSGSQAYSVTIGCAAITVSPASPLPSGQAGAAYTQTITASPAGSYTFSLISGGLPSGLTLNPTTGLLSGTPGTTGTFSFTVQALAGSGCTASQSYTLAINCPGITLTPAALPAGTAGTAYTQTIVAGPVGGGYTYSVTSGALPTGLSLNSSTGSLSGTPSASGSFNFTITATGWGGCTGNQAYSVTIGGGGCPTITLPAGLPNGSVGQLYNAAATASPAGLYSYTVTSGSLPPGVTLFAANGLLFGFPTAMGTYSFTITATQGACSGSRMYTVAIGAGFASSLRVFSDFDGDGKSDLSVFRGSDGNWLVANSGDGQLQAAAWGAAYEPYNDVAVSGDYDGDGKTDLAVWRASEGNWYIVESGSAAPRTISLGTQDDTPVAADYDGDGKADAALWRASDGTWTVRRSSDDSIMSKILGQLGDAPIIARRN